MRAILRRSVFAACMAALSFLWAGTATPVPSPVPPKTRRSPPDCLQRPFPRCKRSAPTISAGMFVTFRTIYSKGAEPASAAATLPPNTLPRSSPNMASSRPAITALFAESSTGRNHNAARHEFSIVPKQGEPIDLKPLDDYVAYDQTQQAQSDIDAEIVYVGYGIVAPEYNWDDYKDVDVRGKVLLMLVDEQLPSDDPAFFKGKALTYYGRWTYKYEEAARKGRPDESSSIKQKWRIIPVKWCEFEFGREIVFEAGRAGVESGVVGAVGRGQKDCGGTTSWKWT